MFTKSVITSPERLLQNKSKTNDQKRTLRKYNRLF